jgi:Tfp pilus assembly protein PilP
MIEDKAGLGYIVQVGTPLGTNYGSVKAIQRDEIIVQESFEDVYGARKKREVAMKLSVD